MIIGISGYAGSGKDTVGKIIKDVYGDESWEIRKFAGKLKEITALILDIPIGFLEDPEYKETLLGSEWDYEDEDGKLKTMKVRDFLQKIGTEGLRKGLHPNVWVNALMAEYRPPKMSEYRPSKWIITDVRFPNEAKAIKDRGGCVIRVNRPDLGPLNGHPSENALDDWSFDAVIDNDGDKNVLTVKTMAAVRSLKFH